MKRFLYILLLVSLYTKQLAQVVINNAMAININGGVAGKPSYLVLNTPPAIPIKTIGTTGGIMMETEFNITKYHLGLLTTPIAVPYFSFNTGSGIQFPLAVTTISGAGITTATASLQFSSTNAVSSGYAMFNSGYDNFHYMPTTVNNMNGYNPYPTFIADNSLNAIDRFWVIDALGYSTSPAVTYNFGYITAEANVNGGNIPGLVGNLQAQAFDQGALTWGNYGPTGVNIVITSEGSVSGVSVGAGLIGNVFRSWTLVNKINVLPVDLLSFSGSCLNNKVNIIWSTANESNSSYFTLEKSIDGQNFIWLANINALGNSSHTQNYAYTYASDINSTAYYRLSETDRNGGAKVFDIITISGCNDGVKENIDVFSGNGNIHMNAYSLSDQPIQFTVYDVTGRLIYKDVLSAVKGNNNYFITPGLANGIYVVEVETSLVSVVKRLPILN